MPPKSPNCKGRVCAVRLDPIADGCLAFKSDLIESGNTLVITYPEENSVLTTIDVGADGVVPSATIMVPVPSGLLRNRGTLEKRKT